MHRSDKASGNSYHIRHYTVDEQGNVIRAFAIGRQWEGRKAVALEGDLATCPKCSGKHAIKPLDSTRKHRGKQVAYDGDLTDCGATLIASI